MSTADQPRLKASQPDYLFAALFLAATVECCGLALSIYTDIGRTMFAVAFGGLILLLPLVFRQEATRGAPLLPSALLAIALASSGLLAIAILAPSKAAPVTEFVSVNTSFPLPRSIAEDVQKKGTAKALDDLQVLAAQDPDVSSKAHQIAHAIGELSLTHYATAGEALAHCRSDFQSGCIHGVVESYLTAHPTQQAFVDFCAQGQVEGSDFQRFNCLHGLGHASLSMSKYNLQQALNQCDLLGVAWDSSSCYGGVFMENVVTLYEGNDFLTTYKPEDHLYPCTGLAQQYLVQCYLMQSSVILILNHYDFAEAFSECDGAPVEFMPVCYQSLGREVSGFTLRSAPESLKLCDLARPQMRDGCVVGAAKNFVDYFGRIDEGVALCAAADSPQKQACYFAIGEEVGVLRAETPQRRADCKLVDAAYVDACLKGARVE